ncbi:hypothetical protein [Desulfatibacillum aliphaticivorans]|nr:hypothetical protein [Desulfatibacillum aliphaticivorans]
MAFGDLRKCPACGEGWVEDDRLMEDPERCPNCGAYADSEEDADGR